MNSIADLPELRALDSCGHLIRIPAEQDIPVTDRVRRLIDSAAFRRLSQISQLGLVSLVYPGATHSRFEHSLGVFRNALLFLQRLSANSRFKENVSDRDAELLIAASLLHDIGHYPFCHPIEDLQIPEVPAHEQLAKHWIEDQEICGCLDRDWGIHTDEIMRLFCGHDASKNTSATAPQIIKSILSGPIDIDKMDYLYRDSLHAGVPYGMHYDRQRLIGSLCVNESADGIAITEKGRTAAELMVFARYVMFSEVYWHHAVRSATAMLQRLFFGICDRLDLDPLLRSTDAGFCNELVAAAQDSDWCDLADCLFGCQRRLYKRLAQYSFLENPTLFHRIAQRPYAWLVDCSVELAKQFSSATGKPILPHEVLIDAPPVCLEVQFQVSVYYPKQKQFCWLGDVSPVVSALAEQQFDNFVKRVRVFVHPKHLKQLVALPSIDDLLQRALQRVE